MVQYTQLYFQEVDFHLPPFLTDPIPTALPCAYHDIGYRHMCRFQAKLVYQQPIMLKELQHAWQLDHDSRIKSPIIRDPFILMKNRRILYGYHKALHASSGCQIHLRENITAFLKENRIPEQKNDGKKPVYDNNFEMSDLKV